MNKNSIVALVSLPLICAPDPTRTTFAWDCHDVLLSRKLASMIKHGVVAGGPKFLGILTGLLTDSARYAFTGKKGPTFRLVTGIHRHTKTHSATVEDFKSVLCKYDPALYALARKIVTEYKPKKGMVKLLRELHKLGYSSHRVATNMSATEYRAISAKNPELFKKFKPGLVVNIAQEKTVRKPDVDFFNRFNENFNADGTEHVIFVDDKRQNVIASRKAHRPLHGIHFKGVKQLRKQLRKRGINVKKK